MAYKRAEWRSGLTYMATCDTCKTVMKYMDDKLDFRPWYADGFVYCPNWFRKIVYDKFLRK